MSYVLDPYKGICFVREKAPEKYQTHSDGFDRFDWESVLPEVEVPVPDSSDQKKSRKELRKEKKESKRKAVAKVMHDTMAKVTPGSSDYNPYRAESDLNKYYDVMVKDKRAEDYVLFHFESVAVYKTDVDQLLPGEWLNDNNISFVYEALHKYFVKGLDFGHHVHFLFPALVQLVLHFPIEEDIKGMLPMDELAKAKLVFIPFNFIEDGDYGDFENANNGDHWALCILSIPERKLLVYDSMAGGDECDDKLLHKFVKRIQKALFKPHENISVVVKKCDQQENFDDCGVYLIMISCFLLSQIVSGDPTDLGVGHVKFSPMHGRMMLMDIMCKHYLQHKTEESQKDKS